MFDVKVVHHLSSLSVRILITQDLSALPAHSPARFATVREDTELLLARDARSEVEPLGRFGDLASHLAERAPELGAAGAVAFLGASLEARLGVRLVSGCPAPLGDALFAHDGVTLASLAVDHQKAIVEVRRHQDQDFRDVVHVFAALARE